MSGEITFEAAATFAAFALAVLAVWWRIEARVKLAERKAEQIEKDLAAYKLAAVQGFASRGHLEDVEKRLTASIDDLKRVIENLPTKISTILAAAPSTRARR
jgi:hypothetical protein